MCLHVSSTCAHHQEVKIVLHSIWYHHTCRWPSGAQVERALSQPAHRTLKIIKFVILSAVHINLLKPTGYVVV